MTADHTGEGARRYWTPFVAIVVVYFVANYLLVGQFGMYEDDWIYLARGFDEPPTWGRVIHDLTHFPQGRPIQFTMMHFGAFIAYQTQSVQVLYILTGFLSAFAFFLWYCVLLPRFGARDALLVTVLTILSPLHSVAQFLNGVLSFAPAMIFVMTATLMQRSENRIIQILSYAVAALTLLTYEVYYVLFALAPWMAAPILGQPDWRKRVARFCVHGVIAGAILLAYVSLRQLLNARALEGIAGDMPLSTVLAKVLQQTFAGVSNSFASIGHVLDFQWYDSSIISLGFIIFGIVTASTLLALRPLNGLAIYAPPPPLLFRADEILLAITTLFAGYVFTFLIIGEQPITFVGRSSRVNVAGVFGFALLIVMAFRFIASFIGSVKVRGAPIAVAVPIALIVVAMPILSINRAKVQSDYALMWSDTKEHFRQAITLAPHAQAGTAIIVEMSDYGFFYPPRAIGQEPQGWPMMVATLLRDGPGDASRFGAYFDIRTTRKPFIEYAIEDNWHENLTRAPDGRLTWTAEHQPGWPGMLHEEGNIIVLRRNFENQAWDLSTQQKYFENVALIRMPQDGNVMPGFWDRAVPSNAMNRLMPDVVVWLRWLQTQRVMAQGEAP